MTGPFAIVVVVPDAIEIIHLTCLDESKYFFAKP